MYLQYTSSIKWQFDSIKEDTSGRITPKGTMLYVHLSRRTHNRTKNNKKIKDSVVEWRKRRHGRYSYNRTK